MRFTTLALLASAAVLTMASPKPEIAKSKRASSFMWFGSNESGAEFGSGNIPGLLGTDYIWPSTSAIQVLKDAGMNIFRVAFLMERLVPSKMTGSADSTYLAALKSTVQFITQSGAYAVIDPHNFGRYYGNVITSTSDFGAFWTTLAKEFASNDKVIFDTNNEYHDMDQTLVLNLNQVAINSIRAAGATSQYIFVEGNSYSGAWTWTTVNDNLKSLTDPQNKIIYEMHQYLDSDGSGTSDACVSSTIGQERIKSATQWLIDNNKRGFLGEFAGGANSVCKTAVDGMLTYMSQNSNVWLGAEWWAAGPWWGTYIFSLEPPSGTGYTNYLSVLKPYFAGGSSTSTSVAKTTSTSTTSSQASTSASSRASTTTSRSSTTSSASSTTPTSVAQRWAQCGGSGWTGATTCVAGSTCTYSNAWYSQCL